MVTGTANVSDGRVAIETRRVGEDHRYFHATSSLARPTDRTLMLVLFHSTALCELAGRVQWHLANQIADYTSPVRKEMHVKRGQY